MDLGTFLLGGTCGAFYLGIMSILYFELRVVEARKAAKDRQFDKFGDASHPQLTPSKVVRESQRASLTYVILVLALTGVVLAYPALACYLFNLIK